MIPPARPHQSECDPRVTVTWRVRVVHWSSPTFGASSQEQAGPEQSMVGSETSSAAARTKRTQDGIQLLAQCVKTLPQRKIVLEIQNSFRDWHTVENCVSDEALLQEDVLPSLLIPRRHRVFQHNRPKPAIHRSCRRCSAAS